MDPPSSPSPLYAGSFLPSSPSPLYQSAGGGQPPSTARAQHPHQHAARAGPAPRHPLSSPHQPLHHLTPSRSSSSSTAWPASPPLPRAALDGHSSSPRQPAPPTVVDKLWRERFKARCSDRVRREREAALRRERERKGLILESSEADGGMDLDEDGDEQDEEVEKEIFRRIMNSQTRRQAREQARLAERSTPSLSALLEDEALMASGPGSRASSVGMDAEDERDNDGAASMADDHDLEAAYMEALMASEHWHEPPAADVAPPPPLTPPACPQCALPPPAPRMVPLPTGALACSICAFALAADGAKVLAQAWGDAPHGGSSPPDDHVPLLSAVRMTDGGSVLALSCSGAACPWAPRPSALGASVP